MKTLPTIKAERVSLRWLTNGDTDSLFEVFSNADVMRYWSSPAMKEPSETETYLYEIHEHFQLGDLFQWGLSLNSDDKVIGTCTLSSIDLNNRRAEIGYALGREHWGKGYMHEALTALLNHAFGEMNLHRIEADVDPRNTGSIKSLEKLGFKYEGLLRERWFVNGEICDTVFYGLLRREWSADILSA